MSDMQNENPYASPEAESSAQNTDQKGMLSEKSMRFLKEASPWIIFISVLDFISCGITVLLGVIATIAGNSFNNDDFSSFNDISVTVGSFVKTFAGFAGLFYIAIGVIIFFPGKFLWSFGTKIKKFERNGNMQDLEKGLENNKMYWKFSGIITIVSFALVPILLIIAAVIAASTAGGL
ncbi:MAG: hypothetical protein Ta2G_15690 [Termitinemataceae bacterium]|nr:MAG: hypothetical protein Ta2G_15690 [Termitinemataceae bacterium]